MFCPFCREEDTKVIDSRLVSEGDQVRRRRECTSCGERYTTYESAELVMPFLVKSDGSRDSFDERKLKSGMLKALQKRPVSTESVESSIHRITHKLRNIGEREISSLAIGELVMDELRHLDHVAYVRFASIYRSFEDVNAFKEEIEKLESEPTPELREHQVDFLDE